MAINVMARVTPYATPYATPLAVIQVKPGIGDVIPTVTFTRSGWSGFHGEPLAMSVAPPSSDHTESWPVRDESIVHAKGGCPCKAHQ